MPARWLLCDYGQVLCTAPPPDEWAALRAAAGYPVADADRFHQIYWRHRPPYDRADITAAQFWSLAAATAPDDPGLEELVRRDVSIWLHPWPESLTAAARAAERSGYRLGLFSNAPVEVSAGIDTQSWLEPFERRFYSCLLHSIKPEPAAYREVLTELNARPEDVVFVDDRPDNVAAAQKLGIDARVFTTPTLFDRL